MFNFVLTIGAADGLALSGAGAYADKQMTNFRAHFLSMVEQDLS